MGSAYGHYSSCAVTVCLLRCHELQQLKLCSVLVLCFVIQKVADSLNITQGAGQPPRPSDDVKRSPHFALCLALAPCCMRVRPTKPAPWTAVKCTISSGRCGRVGRTNRVPFLSAYRKRPGPTTSSSSSQHTTPPPRCSPPAPGVSAALAVGLGHTLDLILLLDGVAVGQGVLGKG